MTQSDPLSTTTSDTQPGGPTNPTAGCDLCEAARITPWFYEDDICWVAECEFCAVPMVVWRRHDPHPSEALKQVLHARLDEVVAAHFGFAHYVDDNMRNIPDHYHAHARRRWTPSAAGWNRSSSPA